MFIEMYFINLKRYAYLWPQSFKQFIKTVITPTFSLIYATFSPTYKYFFKKEIVITDILHWHD